MRMIIQKEHENLILKALCVAENLAIGEVSFMFKEYSDVNTCFQDYSQIESVNKGFGVMFPELLREYTNIKKNIINNIDLDFGMMTTISIVVDAYSHLIKGDFCSALDLFTEIGNSLELEMDEEFQKYLKKIEMRKTFNFLLAREISEKVIYDLAWIINPCGDSSDIYKMPIKKTKIPFIEISRF